MQGLEDTGIVGANFASAQEGENVMSVGGGIHDDAVDVTYSTKPDNPTMATGAMETTTTSSAEFSMGAGAETNLDLGATVGNTINLGTTTTGMEFGATTTTESAGFEATGAGFETKGAEFEATGAGFEATGGEGYEATGAGFETTSAGF